MIEKLQGPVLLSIRSARPRAFPFRRGRELLLPTFLGCLRTRMPARTLLSPHCMRSCTHNDCLAALALCTACVSSSLPPCFSGLLPPFSLRQPHLPSPLAQGFTFGDKLLRAAMVKVSYNDGPVASEASGAESGNASAGSSDDAASGSE